jgi:hypothetical protein
MNPEAGQTEPIFEADEDGFVDFGEVSRQLLGKQSQYGARYLFGAFGEYPNLGENLRIKGRLDNYHFIRIHKDDVAEFIRRYKAFLESQK